MDTSVVRRKLHKIKREKTRSVTYRFPEIIVNELETEAMQKKVSHNVLVKQIVEKYLQWDRFAEKIGVIPVPRTILEKLGSEMTPADVNSIINAIRPVIKESVLFMKGTYDLKRCIETLEDYMRSSGMKSDHRVEGALHHFIVQHELGVKWSLFTEQLFKEIFHEFLPEKKLKCETSDSTVIATIALGADFDEHSY